MTQWDNYRQSIREHLATDTLDNFLQWSTIQATMFVGSGAACIAPEYAELQAEWDRWMPAVGWSGFGAEACHSDSDPNLIHQAYHLKQWLDLTKQDITKMRSIVEVGAGYGAMCLICHRLGFQGKYYIADLPELIEIQRHYLAGTDSKKWVSWALRPKYCDLLIASHSLGEMPIPERERLLSQVATKEYLFASSYEYEGVDNAAWFQQFAGSTVGVDWKFYPHRWQENAFYQVGVALDV